MPTENKEKAYCKYCKKEFEKHHPSQKFCCDQCRWDFYNKKASNKRKKQARKARKTPRYYDNGIKTDYLGYALMIKDMQSETMSEDAIQGDL